MNFVEFVNLKGVCRTAAGHKIHELKTTGWDKNYPLFGKVEWEGGYLMPMEWDKEGNPKNPTMNHGLNLNAVIPKVVFESLNIKELDCRELPREYIFPIKE